MNQKHTENRETFLSVLKIAREIPDDYIRTITLSRIALRLMELGIPEAKLAFKLAVSSVEEIDNPVLMIKALLDVSKYLHRAGSGDLAKATLQQAYESVLLLRGPIRDDLLKEIALAAMAQGLDEEAAFYALDMSSGEKDAILLGIVKNLVKKGKLRKATLIAERIEDDETRSEAYYTISQWYLSREQFATVLALMSKMDGRFLVKASEELGRRLSESDLSADTYGKFAEAVKGLEEEKGIRLMERFLLGFLSKGKVDTVAEVVNSLKHGRKGEVAAYLARKTVDKPSLLGGLIGKLSLEPDEFDAVAKAVMDELLEGGIGGEYLPVVLEIGRRTESEAVLVKVTTYLARLGEIKAAERFAAPIEEPYFRSLAFGAIALAKLRGGDIDGAIEAAAEVKDRKWGSWLMGEILVKVLDRAVGESADRELGKKAADHRKLIEGKASKGL
ncbi:hypothetical protein [Thermococcus sp.]|uniref:hypothetical protein n=2 Tax=Thermococcus sp. TaxID=35749 RepID=UPI0026294E14|nr:hypothetical protein [Thermococcus sp.]